MRKAESIGLQSIGSSDSLLREPKVWPRRIFNAVLAGGALSSAIVMANMLGWTYQEVQGRDLFWRGASWFAIGFVVAILVTSRRIPSLIERSRLFS